MRNALILLAALPLCACMEQNLGLESQHKPIVEAGRATVHNCPDWSSQGVDSAAGTDSNYGCATNANLAAMIADPDDLVHGHADTGSQADVAMKSITAWRTAPAGGGGSGGTSGGTPSTSPSGAAGPKASN